MKGERKTVSLEFRTTSRPGVYALHKQWADEGTWTLVVGVTQGNGEGNTVKAVVELNASGRVASVDVPTVMRGRDRIPGIVSMKDVDARLRERAGRVAAR